MLIDRDSTLENCYDDRIGENWLPQKWFMCEEINNKILVMIGKENFFCVHIIILCLLFKVMWIQDL